MDKISIEQFKEESNRDIIIEIMKNNNGYITSKELDMFDIHRMYLKILQKENIIEKVGTGIYIDSKLIPDLYYIFSLEVPNTIFSHMTALYFHGLSIKAPDDEYDITVRQRYNSSKARKNNVFYIKDELYDLGLTKVKTPMGNLVKVYDVERCICDIIRSKKRMDLKHIKYSIKTYLKRKDKDLVKLLTYAEKMNIKEEVMGFVSMLYD